jgi:hypothetical protein
MAEPLRPSNLGEILDRTIQIYRSRFWVFVGIAMLPAMTMFALHLMENPWLHGPPNVYLTRRGSTAWTLLISVGFYHVASLLSLLFSPAQVYLTSTATLGESVSIRSALRFALARWRGYLWVAVLKLSVELMIPEIIAMALITGGAVVADKAGAFTNESSGFIAFLVIVLPAVAGLTGFLWLGSCLSLAIPAAALEGTGGFRALRRSWVLSRKSRMRLISTWLTIFVLAWGMQYGLRLLFQWGFIYLSRGYTFGAVTQGLYLPASYLIREVISALLGPIYPIALTLFYYDQRIRHEGYDIERLMDAAGMIAHFTPPAGESPVAAVASIVEEVE